MNLRPIVLFLALCLLAPWNLRAHVGSPDVFFDGNVGPYPAHVTIRMPPVVPGRARIEVRPEPTQPLSVSFLPLYSRTAIKNAPPAEVASPVADQPGLYAGDLWLMSVGAYSIQVRLAGPSGEGVIQIPVNSVATHQMPLPAYLRDILLALGSVLTFGGVAIAYAAAGESVLAPEATMQWANRRRGIIASIVTTLVLALALAGGWHWWQLEEQDFRRHLRDGAWPDLAATIESVGPQRVLHLTVGEKAFEPDYSLPLVPDHGKPLHLFLLREPAHDVFAHVHPVRCGGRSFDLLLPELPEGTYRLFADLTLSDSGLSSTASTTLQIPPLASQSPSPEVTASVKPDADDAWAAVSPAPVPTASGAEAVCTLPGGGHATWRSHPPLRARHNAHLDFEFRDAHGQPLPLEPYMGMMSHAAILRTDGAVFAHLHPTGNYSMAAQAYFATKAVRENAPGCDAPPPDHTKLHAGPAGDAPISAVSIPYEFPSAGDYVIWVQVKSSGQVFTAAFSTTVAP
jgi:hypothetical protein